MKEKEMMKGFDGIQTMHKSNETFQFKVIVRRIVVGLLLATMLVGVFSLVGCTQNVPSTDTQSGIADTNSDIVIDTDLGTDLDTNLDTNLDTDLGQPPLDTDDPIVDPDNPDVNPDKELAEAKMKEINYAYDTIKKMRESGATYSNNTSYNNCY